MLTTPTGHIDPGTYLVFWSSKWHLAPSLSFRLSILDYVSKHSQRTPKSTVALLYGIIQINKILEIHPLPTSKTNVFGLTRVVIVLTKHLELLEKCYGNKYSYYYYYYCYKKEKKRKEIREVDETSFKKVFNQIIHIENSKKTTGWLLHYCIMGRPTWKIKTHALKMCHLDRSTVCALLFYRDRRACRRLPSGSPSNAFTARPEPDEEAGEENASDAAKYKDGFACGQSLNVSKAGDEWTNGWSIWQYLSYLNL